MSRGMTLLELVVGLTVMGIVLAAGVGTVAMLSDRRGAVAEVLDEDVRAAAARRAIVGWLSGARVTGQDVGPTFRGLDGARGDLPDDDLTFLTTTRTPLDVRETLVRLYVDRDSTTPERGLTAVFSEYRGTAERRLELAPAVAGIEATYRSALAPAGRTLPSWISSTVLPAAVELRFSAGEGDTLPPLLALPVVAGFRGGR